MESIIYIVTTKKLLRKSEIKGIVAKECHIFKEFGARKIHHSLKDMCYDLSKKAIQSLFNQDKVNIQRSTCFSNNAVLRPIRTEKIQTRSQIGLIDMRVKITLTSKGKQYRYILSV